MYMSKKEIINKYEEHWVYLINCKKTKHGATEGGEVVLATKTLDELFDGMKAYENDESEKMFFGIPSKDTVFLL